MVRLAEAQLAFHVVYTDHPTHPLQDRLGRRARDAGGGAGAGGTCDGRTEQRLDQESYVAMTDRVYVYAPDIEILGAAEGWRPFHF